MEGPVMNEQPKELIKALGRTPMRAAKKGLAGQVADDHAQLLERLHSLDNCLESILYCGEAGADLEGFRGLRLRCQELHELLRRHIPEEEEMFHWLKGEVELRDLLAELVKEHEWIQRTLESCLRTLDAIDSCDVLSQDLFTLQDQVRAWSAALQRHIRTEEQSVLPLVAAGTAARCAD